MSPKLLGVVAVGAALMTAPAAALADGVGEGLPAARPVSAASAEGRLRAAETGALGAEHAAAHASQRELAARASDEPSTDSGRGQASRAAAPRAAPSEGGAWSPAMPLGAIAINAVMLPTGKVLMFAYPHRPREDQPNNDVPAYTEEAEAYVWDPVSGASKSVAPPTNPDTGLPTNIWCAGASLLADGRVLVTGGNVANPLITFQGLKTVFVFDPFTETWDDTPQKMRQGRWYPSQLRMPDGRTLIISGLTRPGDPDYSGPAQANDDLEIFSPGGTLELNGLRFNGSGPPHAGLYPRLFWMPSGRVMAAGPFSRETWFLEPKAPGTPWTWSDANNLSVDRQWGSAVQLSGGRVLALGGTANDIGTTDTTEIFDENNPGAGWTADTPLQVPRSHANSVILPDGKIVTIGGGLGKVSGSYDLWQATDAHKQPEIYDPATRSRVLGNPQAEMRTYHSSALLLPDGRVMSAGDDVNGAGGAETGFDDDTAEIYSPPYLFKGPRPTLDSVAPWAGFGDQIEVQTAGAPVTQAVLVAPGAATHATDMNQRRVELEAPTSRQAGHVVLRMPTDPNLALPGYYMLFLLSDQGVPSVARFIRIDASGHLPPLSPLPQAPQAKLVVKLSGKLPRMRTVRRTKRFRLTVEVSAPATVRLSALLDRGKTKKAMPVVTPRRTTFKAAGKRRVTFTLTRSGLRRLKARRRAVLRIRAKATFAAGRTLPTVQVRRGLR